MHTRTVFVVVADDGVLDDISQAKTDAALVAVAGGRGLDLGAALLSLEAPLPLVVGPHLVATHPPDQTLALADGEGLQQALVNLHVLAEYVT